MAQIVKTEMGEAEVCPQTADCDLKESIVMSSIWIVICRFVFHWKNHILRTYMRLTCPDNGLCRKEFQARHCRCDKRAC